MLIERGWYLQQEIATVNLGKFRKLQHELEEAEARAMLAEKSLSQLRAMSRQSTTSVTETVSVCLQLCHVIHRSAKIRAANAVFFLSYLNAETKFGSFGTHKQQFTAKCRFHVS